MKTMFFTIFTSVVSLLFVSQPTVADNQVGNSLCSAGVSFEKRRLAGDQVDDICRKYAGKVMLIVNTASKCGFTYQYEGLETLYDRYKERGLVVLGFPSNDFGGQEPGSEKQIQSFCINTYAIKFPMYEKTQVKGSGIDALYSALIRSSGSEPQWNFHKYLVDRNGTVVSSYNSSVKPLAQKLVNEIEKLLQQAQSTASFHPSNERIERVVF